MIAKKLIATAGTSFLLLLLCITGAQSAPASPYRFTITLTNHSNNVLTPAPFITHDTGFDLFSEGSAASPEVEKLAEDGITTGVEALASAGMISGSVLDSVVAANGGPITPGTSVTFDIMADPGHGMLSFMSMLAFSNDAFIGGAFNDSVISLFSGGTPVLATYMIAPGMVWDAGTEINDELAAHVPALGGMDGPDQGGVITIDHPGILGVGDVPADRDWTHLAAVASIEVSSAAAVPVPGSMILLISGLLGVAGCSRINNRSV